MLYQEGIEQDALGWQNENARLQEEADMQIPFCVVDSTCSFENVPSYWLPTMLHSWVRVEQGSMKYGSNHLFGDRFSLIARMDGYVTAINMLRKSFTLVTLGKSADLRRFDSRRGGLDDMTSLHSPRGTMLLQHVCYQPELVQVEIELKQPVPLNSKYLNYMNLMFLDQITELSNYNQREFGVGGRPELSESTLSLSMFDKNISFLLPYSTNNVPQYEHTVGFGRIDEHKTRLYDEGQSVTPLHCPVKTRPGETVADALWAPFLEEWRHAFTLPSFLKLGSDVRVRGCRGPIVYPVYAGTSILAEEDANKLSKLLMKLGKFKDDWRGADNGVLDIIDPDLFPVFKATMRSRANERLTEALRVMSRWQAHPSDGFKGDESEWHIWPRDMKSKLLCAGCGEHREHVWFTTDELERSALRPALCVECYQRDPLYEVYATENCRDVQGWEGSKRQMQWARKILMENNADPELHKLPKEQIDCKKLREFMSFPQIPEASVTLESKVVDPDYNLLLAEGGTSALMRRQYNWLPTTLVVDQLKDRVYMEVGQRINGIPPLKKHRKLYQLVLRSFAALLPCWQRLGLLGTAIPPGLAETYEILYTGLPLSSDLAKLVLTFLVPDEYVYGMRKHKLQVVVRAIAIHLQPRCKEPEESYSLEGYEDGVVATGRVIVQNDSKLLGGDLEFTDLSYHQSRPRRTVFAAENSAAGWLNCMQYRRSMLTNRSKSKDATRVELTFYIIDPERPLPVSAADVLAPSVWGLTSPIEHMVREYVTQSRILAKPRKRRRRAPRRKSESKTSDSKTSECARKTESPSNVSSRSSKHKSKQKDRDRSRSKSKGRKRSRSRNGSEKEEKEANGLSGGNTDAITTLIMEYAEIKVDNMRANAQQELNQYRAYRHLLRARIKENVQHYLQAFDRGEE